MRDRGAAFDGTTKSSKTAANILRIACLALALMVAQVAQSLDARAHVRCARIDELQTYNDPAIATLIEGHYGTKDVFVGRLSNRFYLVRLGPADCGYPTCLHRVVQVTDGAVQERFALHATGRAWLFTSYAYYFEPLKDVLDPIAFETSEDTWIVVHLPDIGNVFVVNAESWAAQPRCGRSGNSKSKP